MINAPDIICLHVDSGTMIPQQDTNGNYIKPEYMLCKCRAVVKIIEPKGEEVKMEFVN